MNRKIQFVLTAAAGGHRVIDPKTFPDGDNFGGGSRAGFMGLVRAMAARGDYEVTAVSTFNEKEQVHEGARWVRLDRMIGLPAPDVLFAYYDTAPLVGSDVALRIASHHTLIPFMAAWDHSDINTAPCQYAVDHLRRGFHPHGQWRVLPNAVSDLDDIERRPVPGRVLYHTSPDRGLHNLLAVWPQIRAWVPDATLHVVGDVSGLVEADIPRRSVRGFMQLQLQHGLRAAEVAGGLTLLGRLTRPELMRELSEAYAFAFPAEVTAPCETWSISVHECCHIGLPVVLAPVDALGMWESHVSMTAPACGRESLDEFAQAVVRVLVDPEHAHVLSAAGRSVRTRFSFDRSAKMLHAMIAEAPHVY